MGHGNGTGDGPAASRLVRRAITVDARPDGHWDQGALIDAWARDDTCDTRGRLRTRAAEHLAVRVDADGRLRRSADDGGDRLPDKLVGLDARHGFRSALAAHYAPCGSAGALQAALLDDLPGLRIVSGYARMLEHHAARRPFPASSALIGVCAGWREDGSAARAGTALPGLLVSRPVAEDRQDDRTWPVGPPPLRSGMRRRRLLQVTPGKNTEVYGYFRDTYCRPDGVEIVVHEYEMTATLTGDPPVVADLSACPGALPFPECPAAAESALLLHGVPIEDIEPQVRRRLTGTLGCTHLNDLLRTLRLVEPMTALLRDTYVEPCDRPEDLAS